MPGLVFFQLLHKQVKNKPQRFGEFCAVIAYIMLAFKKVFGREQHMEVVSNGDCFKSAYGLTVMIYVNRDRPVSEEETPTRCKAQRLCSSEKT